MIGALDLPPAAPRPAYLINRSTKEAFIMIQLTVPIPTDYKGSLTRKAMLALD